MRLRSLLLVGFVLGSCSKPSEELRAGAVLVDSWTGPPNVISGVGVSEVGFLGTAILVAHYRTMSGSIVEHPDPECPGCPGTGTITGGSGAVFIARSEDEGRTFASRPAEVPWGIEGLFSTSGQLYAVGWTASVGAGGEAYDYYEVRRFDPDSLTVVADPGVDGPKLPAMLRPLGYGRYASLARNSDKRSGVTETTWFMTYSYFEPMTGRLSQNNFHVPVQACIPSNYELWDASTYFGYCGSAEKVCQIRVSLTGNASSRCTPGEKWPAVLTGNSYKILALTTAGSVWVNYDGNQSGDPAVAATLLDDEEAPRTWRLPGPVAFPPWSLHHPFAHLLMLNDGRFVELAHDGSYQVLSFAKSPCENDGACPTARIVRLERLVDRPGEYLAFYTIEGNRHLTPHRLVALAQVPEREVVAPNETWPAPKPEPEPTGPEGADPAGPADRFCTLVEGCFGIPSSNCSSVVVPQPWSDHPARSAMAAARTCADALAAWPELAMVGTPCKLATNDYGWGYGCQDSAYVVCEAHKVALPSARCYTSKGVLECDPNVPCTPAPQDCPATEPTCEGDTLVHRCPNGEFRFDCSFVGMSCEANPDGIGACRHPNSQPELCQAYGRRCDGRYLLFCRDESLRYVDCTEVGKTRCAGEGDEARCE